MGGKLISVDKGKGVASVFLNRKNKLFTFTDNGGEINVSKDVVVGESVPYWDNTKAKGAVGPATLAYRLSAEIDGEKIDYDVDHD
jgi:hypothetical protein